MMTRGSCCVALLSVQVAASTRNCLSSGSTEVRLPKVPVASCSGRASQLSSPPGEPELDTGLCWRLGQAPWRPSRSLVTSLEVMVLSQPRSLDTRYVS